MEVCIGRNKKTYHVSLIRIFTNVLKH